MAIKRPIIALSLLILVITLATPQTLAAPTYYDAKVADASDRAYEPALIELLDNAQKSIIISMYVISSDPAPIKLLLNDLAEALDRGVTVEIYLNTQFKTTDTPKITAPLKNLTKKGAKIYLASPLHMLHDKLIIIDQRYVVEGSTNWSVSALKANYESATIIDSPALAQKKTIRVRNILLKGMEDKDKQKDRPDRPKIKAPLPETIQLPLALLEDKKYFPTMRNRGDNRSINTYLLLIAESARTGKNEFFLNLENFAALLMMSEDSSDTARRRQIIKTLNKLANRYALLTATFTHGKDAYITLNGLSGATFTAPSSILDPETLAQTSPTAKTTLLIGLTGGDYPEETLTTRFHISPRQYKRGEKELERVGVE